ncbi:DUF3800 domain-containing protein [Nocardia arizonensis]|uniref:DUF3800 domain-containing protein n=1 Tax=Nocardia arizonensis TaxID=1141647 RepID=UPI0006D21C99|nr:DUF3800 domain-containing protein [Nocardia arizonensis]
MADLRLIYVDDSGFQDTGWIVYGWLDCTHEAWRACLRDLLEMRKELYLKHSVPVSEELHATKYINGRARIVPNAPAETQWKTLGREVAVHCLTTLRDCPHITVGSVYRRTDARGKAYFEEKAATYAALVRRWDRNLASRDEVGIVNMDGDGTDKTYFDAHRALALNTRHVIEDPLFHDSKRSQLIQMADLVAWTTYASLHQHKGNRFAWNWYDDYLAASDVDGRPTAI